MLTTVLYLLPLSPEGGLNTPQKKIGKTATAASGTPQSKNIYHLMYANQGGEML